VEELEIYKDRQQLLNIVALFLSQQGLEVYEARPKSEEVEFVPDYLALLKRKVEVEVEHRIDVIVETCESIGGDETRKKLVSISENARKANEGVMLFVPSSCLEKTNEILEELKIADIIKVVPLSFKLKEGE
jgi:hypothetical protein